MSVTTTRRAIVRLDAGRATPGPDDLAVEAPLVLGLHGGPTLATIMRTPGHDVELAAGWLVAESGVRAADDVIELRSCRADETDRLDVRLREDVVPPRPRAFLTSSACGVCSADLIDLDILSTAAPSSPGFHVSAGVLAGLPPAMRRQQRLFARTGSVHAAALARADGTVLAVREDIGRHNAVDKIVGWALLDGRLPLTDHLIVVSGRVSFEIVQKTAAAGAAGIVAVSAPSSLAVDLCRTHDLVLAGLVRNGRLNLYAGADLVQ
jgi:FdhD protein